MYSEGLGGIYIRCKDNTISYILLVHYTSDLINLQILYSHVREGIEMKQEVPINFK